LSISFLSGVRREGEDREFRTHCCTCLAEDAAVRDDHRVVVALCVEVGRYGEHVDRAVLDAERAALAAFDAYFDASARGRRLGQDRRAGRRDIAKFTRGRSVTYCDWTPPRRGVPSVGRPSS
jgi:hypothetical protein